MARHKRHYLPFKRARAAARRLKLKSQEAWWEWSKSGKRPRNIPSNPSNVYRDSGWISMPDWLGYEGQRRGKRKARSSPSNGDFGDVPRGKKRKRSRAKPFVAAAVAAATAEEKEDEDEDEDEEEEEEEEEEATYFFDPVTGSFAI